jgi:hypothetical protein
MNPTVPPIPDGYKKDAAGRLVPLASIRPIDLTRDALVRKLAARALELTDRLRALKEQAFDEITVFTQLSAEEYGVTLGGKKGNLTLISFDGQYKIQRQIQEFITFDERLQAAKELIDQCITGWAAGSPAELHALINDAFQVDKAGNLNTGRILALRRLDITDPRWLQAMRAIGEALQIIGSTAYLRLYQRDDETGKYQPIPLDIAGV